MVELILGIIEESLVLVNKLVPEESQRIRNKVINLRKDWDEEISKGNNRSDANLDRIERELRDLCSIYSSTLKQATSKDKS